MGTRTALTVTDLEKLPPPPENEGKAWELSEGELILVGNAKLAHEHTKYNVQMVLAEFVRGKKLGVVYSESGFVLAGDTFRIPDVSVILKDRLAAADPGQHLRIVPNIAIEVISDSERALDIETKLNQYLRAGVDEVWQIFTELEQAVILTRDGRRAFSTGETLTTPVLPGFETPVAAFFEPVSQ